MSDIAHPTSNNNGSGILQEALTIVRCDRKEATHFVIQHGNRLKFLIDLESGIGYLKRTIAAYDIGLILLLRLISFIPKRLLIHAKLGFFANVKLHPTIAEHVPSKSCWNILVGTYDRAQKLIFQCFSTIGKPCFFIKIGNRGSAEQMEKEMRFLQHPHTFESFDIPRLSHSELISEGAPFNIQITDAFEGNKIPPVLNKKIYQIAKEIAGEPTLIDGIPYTFSHGDFAPWNIRKKGSSYTVFDWEHCGMRPLGYDAAYFIIMTEVALHKRCFNDAFEIACQQLHQLEPDLELNRELIFQEFARTTKALSY